MTQNLDHLAIALRLEGKAMGTLYAGKVEEAAELDYEESFELESIEEEDHENR
jgi:hypothetical protein